MENVRQYTKEHMWIVNIRDNIFQIGITEYAQENLGTILFLNLPDKGDALQTGESFGDIESVKTVSDLISPVTGKVIRVNEALFDEPSMVNAEPYAYWLVEAEAEILAEGLMDEETYRNYEGSL